MKIIYGNIFDGDTAVIAHQVNCQGVMGSGVAKQVRERFPEVYEDYKSLCETVPARELLGLAQGVATKDRLSGNHKTIINLFAQEEFGYDGKCYTDYIALSGSLCTLREMFPDSDVAFPYLMGCHRGGGDWEKVSKMIDDIFGDNAVIYKYQEG